jgi:hypothetical protein
MNRLKAAEMITWEGGEGKPDINQKWKCQNINTNTLKNILKNELNKTVWTRFKTLLTVCVI